MANTFNIKQFLQENKVGPYAVIKESSKKKKKSLKENYIDLRPVGAGNMFGGYTNSLNEEFEVHYSDGVRSAKKFKSYAKALSFAKELIDSNPKLQHVEVFNAGSGFHSTADPKYLLKWWGDRSYFDNLSKEDPSLIKKKLTEDDIYMGPKKPEPHQIYNTPQGEEELGEDNAWMKDVHNKKVGDWQVDYDSNPGVLIWTCYNDSSFYAVATPKWDNQPGTPIEIVKVEEDSYIGDDVHMLYTEKQDEFVSFEEYAETIEPILEKYLQAKKRGEVDEDINNGPVGNDKLEEFEDDDTEHMDRLHAVLDQAAFQRFVKSVTIIAEDLLQDGFEPEDIEDFLVKEIRSIIG
jgi:hypothetical protein